MKKLLLFACCALITAATLNAQITYTSTDYGNVGDSLFYSSARVDTSSLNFALAGVNVTWNFARLTANGQSTTDFLNPATAGYKAAFLAECLGAGGTVLNCNTQFNSLTNLAFRDVNPVAISGYTFRNIVNNDFKSANSLEENIIGMTVNVSGVTVPLSFTYSSPDVLLAFPLVYGNLDSSTSAYNIDLTSRGVSFVYHVHSKRVNHVESWGSLTTPFTTYSNTIRLLSNVLHTDTLFYNGSVLPITPYVSFQYKWFAVNYKGAVFIANGTYAGFQQRFSTVSYLDTIRCLQPIARQQHNPAPPVINPSVGSVQVNFNNFSANANSYTWIFGDPASGSQNTSTAINSTHIYTNGGVYNLELIACNTACTTPKCDTLHFNINVLDSGVAHAAFIPIPGQTCVNDSVRFRNNSTPSNGAQYLWNFGDLHTSTAKNPSHIYTQTGTFTVTLIVTAGSKSDTTTRTVTVNSQPQAAINATGPTTFCYGDSVTLYASGGTIYRWSTGHVGPYIKVKNSGNFTVTATNSCGQSVSAPFRVTVNITVDTVTTSGSTQLCQGDSVKLQANIVSGGTYQWKRNGQVIAGANQNFYYAKTSGNYLANIFQGGCEGISNITHVAIQNIPPATIYTTGSRVICTGDSLQLVANAGPNLTYQWQKNGVNISGATTAHFYADSSGNYTAIVSRNGCSRTSNGILISSNITPTPQLVFSGNGSICSGDSLNISTAAGIGYTYQWQQNAQPIPGATSDFYYASAAGTYNVIATNNGCNGTSGNVVVTVNASPSADAGIHQSIVGCSFSAATIGGNPSASGGTGPYSYLWSPATGLNFDTVANPTVSQIGISTLFHLQVMDANGCTATDTVSINVTGSNLAVSLTSTGNSIWCFGAQDSLGLTANVFGGTGPYIYNWSPPTYLSSTDSAKTVAKPTVAGNYFYTLLVTDQHGCQSSAVTGVTVVPVPQATIAALDSPALCQGDSVEFAALPGAGYTYLWYLNGDSIPGQYGINYTTSSAGSYSVSVTSSVCGATSNPITVTVKPLPTALITALGDTAFCTGGNVTLSASSANGYVYQWMENGFSLSGGTSSTYVASDSGSFSAAVTLNGCTVLSNSIGTTVNPYPMDSVIAGGPTTFCFGDSVVVSTTALPGYTYQWQLNGSSLPGAISDSTNATVNGTYTVAVTALGCTATSTGVQVTVYEYPVATITAQTNLTFCSGDSVILSAPSDSTYNYQWFNYVNGSTDTLPVVTMSLTAVDSGLYFAVITQNICSSTTNSLYVNVNPLPLVFITGDSVTLTSSPGSSYQWYNGSTAITGATQQTFTPTVAGNYSVIVTDANGCSQESAPYPFTPVGISVIPDPASILIYPNPAHDALTINFESGPEGNISIRLYDLVGSEVATVFEGKTTSGSNIYNLSLASLQQGMYLLRISDGKTMATKKVVKQ